MMATTNQKTVAGLLFMSSALIVGTASDAVAHCYSIWRYPWRQNCRATSSAPHAVRVVRAVVTAAAARKPVDEQSWSVEITKMPSFTPDQDSARQNGIEELKIKMKEENQ